jgi:hypothetical protein
VAGPRRGRHEDGLIDKPVLYVIGTVVTAAGVVVLKSTSRKEAEEVEPAASRQATATS